MKIGVLIQPWNTVYPPDRIGSSISIIAYELAKRLALTNDVTIYGKMASHHGKEQMDEFGVHFRSIFIWLDSWLEKVLKLIYRYSPLRNPKRPYFSSYLYYPGYAIQVGMQLRKTKCDIVHIFNFSQFAPIIRLLAPRVKIVLHMQCEWLTQLDEKVIRRRIQYMDRVLGCSDYITRKIQDAFPEYRDLCATLYNGVDSSDFNDADRSVGQGNKILFVGRVSPEKGVHLLLSAFQEVMKTHPDARLTVIGTIGSIRYDFAVALDEELKSNVALFYAPKFKKSGNTYFSYLKDQLSPAVRERVDFVGGISHPDTVARYRSADVFVFTSIWDEPFGIPMVEAMSCGLPVAAIKGGAVPEIVQDGITGFVVDRGNVPGLVQAIGNLLENEELRGSMGRVGRQRAIEMFSWNVITKRLLDYYESLMHEHLDASRPSLVFSRAFSKRNIHRR